jgi:hypothetical protein
MKSQPILKVLILITCFIAVSCKKEPDSLDEGLLFYYPFNGNVNDASGHKNNGIDYTSGNYVSGIRGKALDFNGTSDYIELSRTINSGNGLTFSFWIKSRGAAGTENNGVIIGKYNMSASNRCFLVYAFGAYEARSDNRLSAAFYKEGFSSAYHDNVKSWLSAEELKVFPSDPSLWTIANPVRIETGKWTHCIINVTETDIEAWVNGILCTKKHREHPLYFDSGYEPVYIGNCLHLGAGSDNHFNGVIDELRIYNRGLTSEEIHILFSEKR